MLLGWELASELVSEFRFLRRNVFQQVRVRAWEPELGWVGRIAARPIVSGKSIARASVAVVEVRSFALKLLG